MDDVSLALEHVGLTHGVPHICVNIFNYAW